MPGSPSNESKPGLADVDCFDVREFILSGPVRCGFFGGQVRDFILEYEWPVPLGLEMEDALWVCLLNDGYTEIECHSQAGCPLVRVVVGVKARRVTAALALEPVA